MISKFLTMSWTYNGRVITELSDMPEDTFGFIYKITNGQTGQYYIGKKQVVSIRKRKFGKKEIAKLEDKRMKRYEMVEKESDWKKYRSSNPIVQLWFHTNEQALTEDRRDDINDRLELKILKFCKNKKALTYYELQEQFSHDVLGDEMALNDNLLGKFFRKDLDN
tara:strand:- start:1037 stop:1531 length:495 start_codon:yes stop_codon:yes gene_type:complete